MTEKNNTAKANLATSSEKETLYFEDIKGQENLIKAKIHRNGRVHEITVLAVSEASFDSKQTPIDNDSTNSAPVAQC